MIDFMGVLSYCEWLRTQPGKISIVFDDQSE